MQIGSRFTEYGLTGGFFWICQLVFLTYSGQAKTLLSYLPTVKLPPEAAPFSQIASTAISSLVAALAIIAVFVAGLLLDLSAVYFRSLEIRAFNRHLVRNRDWLVRLIADHKAYCEADYEAFEHRFGGTSFAKDMLAGFGVFLFWKQERRQQYVAAMKRGWGWKLGRPYERLWSFFTSYILVQSGSSQLSLMVDQYYLWRTGRAVSVSLVILSFEVLLPYLFPSRELSFLDFLVSLIPSALSALAVMITLETYSRLCFTLFALVYVTEAKRSVESEKTA